MTTDSGDHPEHDELELVGAWLLGGLDDPAEVRRLEEHLSGCSACRAEADALAGLVEPLRRVDPASVVAVGARTPRSLDSRIEAMLSGEEPAVTPGASSARARAARRWSWRTAAGGLVVGAAAASLVLVLTRPEPVPEPPVAAPVTSVGDLRSDTGVAASAGFVDHTWGVELKLEERGLPAGLEYDVSVIDDQGDRHAAGAFLGVGPSRTVVCDLNASVLSAEAARFVVTDPGGRTVIEGNLTS